VNPTQLLLILAIILFIVAAVGTYVAKPAMIAMGWVGLAVVALATVVG
jgi:hypothetical protein